MNRIKLSKSLSELVFFCMLIVFNNKVLSDVLTDAQVIAIYNQVNSFDIEIAMLGQLNGENQSVKDLASEVAVGHIGARKAVSDLARELELVPELPLERNAAFVQHYDVVEKLLSKSAEQFDRAYLKHEIDFHSQAINAIEQVLLPTTDHPKLKRHLQSMLPHFKHHLNETIRIAKMLGD